MSEADISVEVAFAWACLTLAERCNDSLEVMFEQIKPTLSTRKASADGR